MSMLDKLNKLDEYKDWGLLFLRIGIGIMFMLHGFPKLAGGIEAWEKVGSAVLALGFPMFTPLLIFMGLAAALSEFIGGLFLILGLFFRPACLFLLITMVVAASMHMVNGDLFQVYSHALEAAILFLSLVVIGPGEFALDGRVSLRKKDFSQVWKTTLKVPKR